MSYLFFTVPEAALRLRLSSRTVYKLIRSGELTSVKIGRSRRVTEQDIEAMRKRLADETAVQQ